MTPLRQSALSGFQFNLNPLERLYWPDKITVTVHASPSFAPVDAGGERGTTAFISLGKHEPRETLPCLYRVFNSPLPSHTQRNTIRACTNKVKPAR